VGLAVGWRGNGGYTLAAKDCISRPEDKINGGWQGGESTKYDWYVKQVYNPNPHCVTTTIANSV
jgi:hypothetical protein